MAIARAQHSAVYPARFALLAATNPCPCGYLGEGERCACGEAELARHRRRLSGPLLDRIDLIAHLRRPTRAELRGAPAGDTRATRTRVLEARERQGVRLGGEAVRVNAQLDARLLRRHVALTADGERLLAQAQDRDLLSARGVHRVLRVARTAADLEGSPRTRAEHVAEALALRVEAGPARRRA